MQLDVLSDAASDSGSCRSLSTWLARRVDRRSTHHPAGGRATAYPAAPSTRAQDRHRRIRGATRLGGVKGHVALAIAAHGSDRHNQAERELQAARSLARHIGYRGGMLRTLIAELFQHAVAGEDESGADWLDGPEATQDRWSAVLEQRRS
jgi:hypothetical protein